MPWANDGGGFWNDTKCSPVADDPGAVGDACTAKGSGTAGIDDCGLGSMCWDVDPDSLAGSCVAFCQGDPTNPTCGDPSKYCAVVDEEVLALCLAACDPILNSCDEGEMCCARTIEIGADFGCVPQTQNLGITGDPCRYAAACEPGFACVPGGGGSCEDGSNCCAALCSLEDGDPNPACPDADIGQICTPWYGVAAAPPGLEHVGICALR
ncbi:MAG: hypothetical protein IAG13_13550 [Deltaproteobacteria bacterium]|nr:hypothetical protein [Nannocystaceae bacterium]